MSKPVAALDYLAKPEKHDATPVCVVFGDEAFLKRAAIQALVTAALGNDDESDLSLSRVSGDVAELRDVRDELATVAMFGGNRRVVLVESADPFVTRFRGELEDYAAQPISTGVLLLEVNTWPKNTRLYKALERSGLQIDCKQPTEARLLRWLDERAKREHRAQLEPAAAETLLEMIGPEMGLLDQELAKSALAAGPDTPITAEMVRQMSGSWRAQTTWVMLDLALDGKTAEALRELQRLLASGEHPIAILAQIGASLRRFAAATRRFQEAEQSGRRASLRGALEAAGCKPFVLAKSEAQLRRLGRRRGGRLYRWLLEADLAMKGISSSPDRARLVLEQLIVRVSAAELKETAV